MLPVTRGHRYSLTTMKRSWLAILVVAVVGLFAGMAIAGRPTQVDDEVISPPHGDGFGGPGNDRFLLSANQTAANGGLGNDRIEVEGGVESLLIGGPGKDTLIGGSGLTRINALDGRPGDKIVCKAPENLVMADEGDIITGPCTRVYPDNTQY